MNEEKENEIIEINDNDEENGALEYDAKETEVVPNNKNNNKKKINKKLIIIICTGVILVIAIVLILVFVVFKKKDDTKPIPKDVVLIEKDNYTYKDGTLIFKNDGTELGTYECTYKDQDLCFVAYYSNSDFDQPKKVDEDKKELELRSDIYNDFVFVRDNEKKDEGTIKLYNMTSKSVIQEYKSIYEVKDNYVIVEKDTKKYNVLVLEEGKYKELFDKDYSYIGYIESSKYLVLANNNNYSLYDFDGKKVTKDIPGKIYAYNDESISAMVQSKKFVYDYDGTKKIKKGFSYIRFVDKYIIGVDDYKLYIYDNLGNIMSDGNISISNRNDYNTLLVFDNKLNQVGKESFFDAFMSGKELKIEYDDTSKIINMAEGNFNKNNPFISYFDGTLYIYKDSEKDSLIGTYKCKNLNNISDATTSLDKCNIAIENNIIKESMDNNYIPIYNERFAFIKDGDTIYLIDLKQNKELVTYKEVDALYHKNTEQLDFVDTAGTLIIAKNTKDSYGAVNLKDTKVTQVTGFKDSADSSIINTEIKLVDDYIMVKRSDNTYHLFDIDGKELTTKSTTYEIMELKGKYIRVKNKNNYIIYDLAGKIVSNEYKNIKMLDSCYITIDSNNTLGVYKYNSTINLVTNNIVLSSEDYDYVLNDSELIINYLENGIENSTTISLD